MAVSIAKQQPPEYHQHRQLYNLETSSIIAGSQPALGNVQAQKLMRSSEAIEIKQTKLMQTLARDSGAYLSVNITPSAPASNEPQVGSFSSDNSCYKDFILNPAVFSHVIEAGNAHVQSIVQQELDGTSSARRKAAPRMGVKRLNFSSGIDEKATETVSAIVSGRNVFPIRTNSATLTKPPLRATHALCTLPGGPPMNGRRYPVHGGRTLHASRLSLDVSNLADVVNASTSILHANKQVFEPKFSWMKKPGGSSQEIGIQTLSPKHCRCEELNIRREKELVNRIAVLFKLSLIGCLFFPPIGILAILLCLKAKRLNIERTRIGLSEPYALAMTPHFHAHQVNLLTKKVIFCINTVRYSLLAETIFILLTLIAYALFAGIVARCRDLVTVLVVLLATSFNNGNNSHGSLNAFYNTNLNGHQHENNVTLG